MNIEKAIEKLTPYADGEKVDTEMDDLDAFQLGIEALKAIKQDRALGLPGRLAPLPFETDE